MPRLESATDLLQLVHREIGPQLAETEQIFEAELAEKVLPDAESYRLLLENGRCRLIMGHTTDTLQAMAGTVEAQIDTLQQVITAGKRGPYLSFR